jgi:hypothetical protein
MSEAISIAFAVVGTVIWPAVGVWAIWKYGRKPNV